MSKSGSVRNWKAKIYSLAILLIVVIIFTFFLFIDLTIFPVKVAAQSRTIEDIFLRFTKGKLIPVPEYLKENVEEGMSFKQVNLNQLPMILFYIKVSQKLVNFSI